MRNDGRIDSPQHRLLRLMDGFVMTQLLYVATKLGIAQALAAGPRTGAEVAEAVGADPSALTRVLRGLALEDVVSEADGRFALTPLGECLPTIAAAHTIRAQLYYHGAEGLLDAVRKGGTPFELVYGAPFFAYLEGHAEDEAAFNASMARRSEQEASAVVGAYDFGAIRRLVDVGGGRGVLLAAILRSSPGLRGVLVDRPAAVAAAREHLSEFGARAECEAGDFFASLPAGADAYLLSRILHDWEDEDALRILAVCRAAMTGDTRLLVVDAIVPEHAKDQPAAIWMDLYMLLLLGARERTEAEFRALLAKAGFTLRRTFPTGSPAGIGILEAIRAP
jgi:hypothetical protein